MKKILYFLSLVLSLVSIETFGQSCPSVSVLANSGQGTLADTRYSQLNCHAYIRTALLNKSVNMDDGKFKSPFNIASNTSWISTDSRFVKVCNKDHAEAISFSGLPGQPDHSALVLSAGIFTGGSGSFASTPGENSYVYRHGEASMNSGNGTLFDYYAVLPEIDGDSSINNGNTKTYTLDSKPFIQSVSWSVSNTSLTIIGNNTGTSVNVKATCNNGSGSYWVKATVTIIGSGETRTIQKQVSVTCGSSGNACLDNSLDGGTLNTFNYVSSNADHEVVTAVSRSWSKSWGNTNYWYTSNGGKQMNFAISSGCATFTAYNGSCGTYTFTFCASSFRQSGIVNDVKDDKKSKLIPYEIFDLNTGILVRKGLLQSENGQLPLNSLPNGFYVIHILDNKQKIIIRN